MVWHIFRKDWKLLWRMVTGVALINAMQHAMVSSAGPFWSNRAPLAVLESMFANVSLVATAVLVVLLVQEDAIPGLCQDWLVRPIRRRDLLLSKLLFLALLVQGPIFVMEVVQTLAAGFPLGPALGSPVSRSLWMLLAFDLPVLALAALTPNLVQAAGAGIGATVGYALAYLAFGQIWVHDLARVLWGVLAVAVVLALQYYRRKTLRARWAYGAAALVWVALEFVPWQTAFAIQERLSPQPAAADPVQIAFEPGLGSVARPDGAPFHPNPRGIAYIEVWVPLRIAGVADDEMLIPDRATSRITGPGGTEIDLGNAAGWAGWAGPRDDRNMRRQLVLVPQDSYNRMKNQPERLEIDFSLTLLKANPAQAMPAVGGDRWIEGLGRCQTRSDTMGAEVGCLSPGKMPFVAWSLGNQRYLAGQTDFTPYVGRVQGDSISHFSHDFPAEGLPLKDARITVQVYRPEAHFTRHVLIPEIRLSDWRAE
jgi:hypothetical protein